MERDTRGIARRDYRPRPGRMTLYVLIALAAIGAGFAVGTWTQGETEGRHGEVKAAIEVNRGSAPWYRSQTPPPVLVTAPDAPIFPDPAPGLPKADLRPYEDALPGDVYVGHVAPPPPPPPVDEARPVESFASAAPRRKGRDEMPPPKAAPVEVVQAVPLPPPVAVRPAPVPVAPSGETQVASLTPPGAPPLPPLPPVPAESLGGATRPMIALVIDDMGVDRGRSKRIAALPGPLTLSFLTYAKELAEQTAAAHERGHELLVHVPMEAENRTLDAGPNVLRVDDPTDETRRRLSWALDRFVGYVGINNHMGSRFTADARAMGPVMEELRRRSLFFLDSRTVPLTQAGTVALEAGVPFAERNVFLDNVNDAAAVARQLAVLEDLARRKGFAVAIGHPRDGTLAALAEWLPGAESRGFRLVPLSEIVRQASRRG